MVLNDNDTVFKGQLKLYASTDRIRQYIAFKLKNTTDENTHLIDNIGTYLTHIWSFIKKKTEKNKTKHPNDESNRFYETNLFAQHILIPIIIFLCVFLLHFVSDF